MDTTLQTDPAQRFELAPSMAKPNHLDPAIRSEDDSTGDQTLENEASLDHALSTRLSIYWGNTLPTEAFAAYGLRLDILSDRENKRGDRSLSMGGSAALGLLTENQFGNNEKPSWIFDLAYQTRFNWARLLRKEKVPINALSELNPAAPFVEVGLHTYTSQDSNLGIQISPQVVVGLDLVKLRSLSLQTMFVGSVIPSETDPVEWRTALGYYF